MKLRRTVATIMLAAGLTLVPGVVMADTIQGNNHSSNDTAKSGKAIAHNTATVKAGGKNQKGNNSVRITQRSDARSGDAIAGSQVILK